MKILDKDGQRYPLLISMHKSGSAWINSYIHKRFRGIGLTAPPRNLYTEFFPGRLKENMNHIFNKPSDSERIELLEKLRTFGLELNQKAHISEIKYIWPWFKNFFKDYDILIVKRKNIFTHWLTILFFACVRKATNNIGEIDNTAITPSKQTRPMDEDVLKSTIQEYNVQFKFNQGEFDNFVSNIRFLNDVIIRELEQPQVMWLEDISTKWLENRYNVILKTPPPQPFKTLDYKVYFKPEDMAIIKEKFKERFDAEFQFFGYEYK